MFGIKPQTLHYWYKHYLSHYHKDKLEKKWGEKTFNQVNKSTGELKEMKDKLPIVKAQNFGAMMTIDEKQVGKKIYTIMTNIQTNKIGLMAQTMKPEELQQIVEKYLSEVASQVQSISCDMSPSFKKFCRDNFKNIE